MEKGSDISKSLALALILLTVLVSAASTWVLVTTSVGSDEPSGLNDALVMLHILKGHPKEPFQMDSNSGDVKLFISRPKGG